MLAPSSHTFESHPSQRQAHHHPVPRTPIQASATHRAARVRHPIGQRELYYGPGNLHLPHARTLSTQVHASSSSVSTKVRHVSPDSAALGASSCARVYRRQQRVLPPRVSPVPTATQSSGRDRAPREAATAGGRVSCAAHELLAHCRKSFEACLRRRVLGIHGRHSPLFAGRHYRCPFSCA